ncbi:TRAP transporter small permease [Xanthobacteraceae bacterium Astr-EGSB]|uniref:TRAP transporter small permease n=1 Tax=Astrobacterium formosum TaxID=3069710 RepID=UPI0027B72C76|nr:TRAP transporter small permease [Xanthobacteraceae bacterium Astr-EGSB]
MPKLGKFWGWAAALPLTALVVVTIAAVFMRYVVGAPLQWTEEVSGILMIWIVMIGGVAAERDDQHLSIPLLPDALPRRLGLAINIVVSAFSIAVLLYMAWLAWDLASRAQYKLTQILGVSWYWIDIAVTVGATCMAVYMAMRVRRQLREIILSDAEAAGIPKRHGEPESGE